VKVPSGVPEAYRFRKNKKKSHVPVPERNTMGRYK
jgi:hypothetical protein